MQFLAQQQARCAYLAVIQEVIQQILVPFVDDGHQVLGRGDLPPVLFPPRCRTTSRTPSPTVQRLRTAPLAVFLQDVSRVFGLMGSLCMVAARRRYISRAGTQKVGKISILPQQALFGGNAGHTL